MAKKLAYAESGNPEGTPIVFLHGNPTSSYMWRNIFPYTRYGRCLAPDFMGFGESDKLDTSPKNFSEVYTFYMHQKNLDTFMDRVALKDNEKVVLVLHDWGSGLGFDWATRHSNRIAGIAFMEPVFAYDWIDLRDDLQTYLFFKAMQRGYGDLIVLKLNAFIEQVIPFMTLRRFTREELDNYRKPFEDYYSRQPILAWAREFANVLNGKTIPLRRSIEQYSNWLKDDETIPKLFIRADPGLLVKEGSRTLEDIRKFQNLKEVTVRGLHYITEDSPHEIGVAIREWLKDEVKIHN